MKHQWLKDITDMSKLPANIIVACAGVVMTLAGSYAISQFQFQKNENKRQAETLRNDYENKIKPLNDKAMKVCHQWTNTSCQEAKDILEMLKKYSAIRASEKHNIPQKNSPKEIEGYEILEDYRKSTIQFWMEVKRDPSVLPSLPYPTHNEMKAFSTFHWAIYMANNTERREPRIYEFILKQPKMKDSLEFIHKYRETVSKEFEVIRQEAFQEGKT
jgi:ribosomal protein L7/L12